jgi:hypothetical protein
MRKLRSIYGVIVVLLVVVSVALGGYIFSADASTGPSTTGLNTLNGYGVVNETSAVWALNDSGKTATWYSLAFTKDASTNSITFSTPLGKDISVIIVQTKNISQDVYDLLQNGLLYSYATFSLSGTGKGNLTSANMYFGEPVNATSTNAVSDKGITDYALNQSLYNAQASYFGTAVQLQIMPYLASNFGSTPQYEFHLNQSKNATTGVYNPQTITFGQYFEYTSGQQFPLVTYIAIIALFVLFTAMYITYMASPAHDAGEERRAEIFQTQKEMGLTLVSLVGVVGILLIEGFLGSITPLGGWGAAVASLFFFGLFVMAYTEVPQRQKYTRTMGIGLIGMALGLVVEMIWPFGAQVYNFMVSGNFAGMIYGWIAAFFFIGLAYVGIVNTKRYRLHPRNVHRRAERMARKAR